MIRQVLRVLRLLEDDARRVFVKIQSAISAHLEEAFAADLARKKVRKLPLSFAFNTWIGLLHHYLLNRDLFAPEGAVLKRHGKMPPLTYFTEIAAAYLALPVITWGQASVLEHRFPSFLAAE